MGRPAARLTLTEARVARFVAEGRTDDEVARIMATEPEIVAGHLSTVYRKLGVHSRMELALLLTTAPSDRASADDGRR
jgi:DNA-binding CsgD family transcriptional regulator